MRPKEKIQFSDYRAGSGRSDKAGGPFGARLKQHFTPAAQELPAAIHNLLCQLREPREPQATEAAQGDGSCEV